MGLTAGQKACVETLDRSIVVAAGAGSGKTYTLKERIAYAFECGFVDDVDQICAITFTTKAAAELKSRIKAELKACGLIEQSLKVDDAWISTIHGMCSRILKAHAVQLGIDPSFKVLDPADAREFLALAVDDVLLHAQGEQSSARLDALFEEYPARSSAGWGDSVESMLQILVDKAAENPRGADAFVLPGITVPPERALGQAIDLMEGLLAQAESLKGSKSRDAWLGEESAKVDEAREALEQGGIDSVRALELIGPFKVRLTFGDALFKDHAAEVKVNLAALVMDMKLATARPHLDTLVELAKRSLAAFERLKRKEGLLDNSDLLVMAARALEDHPDIAERYVNKFKLVMVDEFQDTNQMQVDMIKRIAGPGACRLCTVGDAQQSIYGFRGADVAVYRRHLKSVQAADANGIIKLSDNFRSHGDVLAFVDRVFEQPSMFGGQFMSLAAKRQEKPGAPAFASGEPRVVVQHTIRPGASKRPLEVARRVAAQFAEWKSRGHAAGEMVVLLRSMGTSGLFAQALREQGFSCVIAGGSVFSESLEATVVRDLVCFIANPGQTQALLNVLASPMFALSAGDLAVAGGGAPRRALDSFGAYAKSQPGGNGEGDAGSSGGQAPNGALVPLPRGNVCGAPVPLPSGNAFDVLPGGEVRTPLSGEGDASMPPFGDDDARTLLSGGDDACMFLSRDGKTPAAFAAIEMSPQLKCALRVIRDVRTHASREEVWHTVERAVIDSGWLSRLDGQGPEGQASAANVHKAIRMLRAIEEDGPHGPATVAARFQHVLNNAKEAPGALSVSEGDSVRIMTFHASKGLEFPLVAVAGMSDNHSSFGKLIASELDGAIYLSLDAGNSGKDVKIDGAAEEALRQYILGDEVDEDELAQEVVRDEGALHRRLALKAHDGLGEAEESKRLLYVAITRAREACIVACDGRATKANPAGLPKGAAAGVLTALLPEGAEPEEGITLCNFGGSAPAVLHCVVLPKEDELPEDAVAGAGSSTTAGAAGANSSATVAAAGADPNASATAVAVNATVAAAGANAAAASANSDASATAAAASADPDAPIAEDAASSQNRPSFAVPAARAARHMPLQTFKALHEGIFSYSSIAEASHEGDVLSLLAAHFAVGVDGVAEDASRAAEDVSSSVPAGAVEADASTHAAADEGQQDAGAVRTDTASDGNRPSGPDTASDSNQPSGPDTAASTFNRPAAQPLVLDEDDDPWGFVIPNVSDEDRATDLGTAFHRLAQFAVVSREAGGQLVMPPEERIRALSRTCKLDALQHLRLTQALERWFASDVARDMANLPQLSAELPFFVALPCEDGAEPAFDNAEPAFLEGEIDLFGMDSTGTGAFVVDYKTGGHQDETVQQLREKHVLQAACYAYAIMLQGAAHVDVAFVRVERESVTSPGQPQCVRYRFSSQDIPELARVIRAIYQTTLGKR